MSDILPGTSEKDNSWTILCPWIWQRFVWQAKEVDSWSESLVGAWPITGLMDRATERHSILQRHFLSPDRSNRYLRREWHLSMYISRREEGVKRKSDFPMNSYRWRSCTEARRIEGSNTGCEFEALNSTELRCRHVFRCGRREDRIWKVYSHIK